MQYPTSYETAHRFYKELSQTSYIKKTKFKKTPEQRPFKRNLYKVSFTFKKSTNYTKCMHKVEEIRKLCTHAPVDSSMHQPYSDVLLGKPNRSLFVIFWENEIHS